MSTKMMIKLLERGETGSQILEILDAITQEKSQDSQQPTLDPIDF